MLRDAINEQVVQITIRWAVLRDVDVDSVYNWATRKIPLTPVYEPDMIVTFRKKMKWPYDVVHVSGTFPISHTTSGHELDEEKL